MKKLIRQDVLSLPVQRQDLISEAMTDIQIELDAMVCSIIAAGVPMTSLILTQPELHIQDTEASVVMSIGFKEGRAQQWA